MNQLTIAEKVKQFIENNILAGGTALSNKTNLPDAGMDSYSIVEIILFIEREYNLQVPHEQLLPQNFETIDAIAEMINRLQ